MNAIPRNPFAPLLILLALAATTRADVTLPNHIGSNMVLQRDKPLPIWGTAEPGERVIVSFSGQTKSATADKNGKWAVKLPRLSASLDPRTMTVQGNNTLTLSNILIGEVWVCSGQSNMEWQLSNSNNAKQEIAVANWPRIRLFTVKKTRANKPLTNVDGSWSECTPQSTPGFSAVSYFFGRNLHNHLEVPVGLIHTSWGGTPAEHWTPKSVFDADPALKETSDHPHAQNVMKNPSSLYNGMIAPLVPTAIRGAIWYQGESNVPMSRHYHKLFTAMITGWRNEWKQGDFPFLYVQIAPWNYGGIKTWPREGCPLVREAQLKTLALKNTGMVVTMDIGNVADIHPRNKQDVGSRLALAARAIAHGERLVYSGPIYKSQKIDGNKVILSFDHVGGGLLAKGGELTHFTIAGKDKQFVPGHAKIVGDTIVVSSEKVTEPTAVRYAFQDDALPNLFNKEALPASPFRTDDE